MATIDVKITLHHSMDMTALSDEELDAEIEKGNADIKAGRTRNVSDVFADIRKDYNL
ncbi:MAG: hypothetical protein LUG60_06545 [Erysipelotrichaceae bacterium]|nr:hypothetical protein [Erysipelotrichaceae bacterium]